MVPEDQILRWGSGRLAKAWRGSVSVCTSWHDHNSHTFSRDIIIELLSDFVAEEEALWLLYPADKQNVPATYKLLQTLVRLSEVKDVSPT